MAKELEEWQTAGEGCWHTADKRFTIVESQSGDYHHLVDNQKLRNSKTFRTFTECEEFASQIRSGQNVKKNTEGRQLKNPEKSDHREAETNPGGHAGQKRADPGKPRLSGQRSFQHPAGTRLQRGTAAGDRSIPAQ